MSPRVAGNFGPIVALIALIVAIGNLAAQTTVVSGVYSGATIPGNITVASSTSATFQNGTTFTGPTASLQTNGGIYWEQTGTLSGKAFSFGPNSYLYLSQANSTLTFDSASSATGELSIYGSGSTGQVFTNQGTLTHTSGTGQIYAPTFTNSGAILATGGTLYLGYPNTYNSTNTSSGTITANGANTTVYIRGNFTNNGTLTAQNSGVLLFDGTNSSGNLGNIVLSSGGHARLNGTLNNTNLAAPTGGALELYGGTISGGTIAAGALTFTSSGGYLDGATLNDNLTIPTNTHVHLTSGASFTGATGTLGNSAGIYWEQTGTLSNKTITLSPSSYLYVNGINNTLTIAPSTNITGDLSIYSSGSAGTAITNQGTLTHTGGSSSIYAPTFTNSGSITATAGTLYLGYPNTYNSTNTGTGTITANGSSTTVYIRGNFSNNGTLTAQNSGVLLFDGTNTSGNLGNIVIASGGHARLNGTVNNTNLTAPNGGTLELYGGTISGGNISANALSFTSSGGYLDGATLNDNLTLAPNTFVRLTGDASFTGMSGTLGNSAGIYWEQTGTLSNKTITLSPSSYLYVNGINNTLTIAPNTNITGDLSIYSSGSAGTAITNQGTLTHTGGSSSIYAPTFTNSGSITATAGTLYLGYPNTYNSTNTGTGTITANGSSTTVYIRGNFSNNGTLTAQNSGVLLFDGTNTSGNLGNIVIASGGHARLNGTVNNTNLTAPNGGTLELYGGTISGGNISANALSFTSSGGYLDGATLNDNLTLAANTFVRFTGGASFTGTSGTLGNSAGIYWEQAGTLSNKTITLSPSSYLYVNGINNTLTIAPSTSITGDLSIYSSGSAGAAITNQGTLTHTGGSSSIYAPTFTNSGAITATNGTLYLGYPNTYNSTNTGTGTVTASGSSTTVYIRGNFSNNGTLTAQNSGVLLFDGTNTSGNLGNIVIASGGHARLNGTVNNTNLTAPNGGTLELYGGTISGGNISANALSFTSSGGYLDGATLNDNLTLSPSTYVRFAGGASFTGANLTLGNSASVYWEQVGSLSNKTITLGSSASIYVNGANNTLTLGPSTTVTGDLSIYSSGSSGTAITNQGTLTHTGGSSSIYAPTFTNSGSITATAGTLYLGYPNTYNSLNTSSGLITANGSGTTVYVRGNFTNNGTIAAQNSATLLFDGSNAASNLGAIQIASGGHAYLNGTITNAGTLAAPTGGSFELFGGTINGGTIANGALSYTSSGGELAGSTISGNLTLPANTHVVFSGGTNFTGTSATLGANAGIYWQQTDPLANKTVSIANGGYLYVAGANNTLTLNSGTSVTGDVSVYSDLNSGTAITNQGTLTHNIGSGQLYAKSFSNAGTITVSSGSMTLGTSNAGSTFANQSGAAINVTGGSSVSLNAPAGSPIQNQGTISVHSGTLFTNNHLMNVAGGLLTGAGTISGNVTMTGGTLAPGNSIGTLTFQSGALTVTGASTFAYEIGGASSDLLVFQNPPAIINLGTGLVSLSVTLLSVPTANTTYNLLNITSGGSGISGTFAGLPSSGSVFSANFNGTPYSFSINYSTNLISAVSLAVPEPSSVALLGVGVLALGLRACRRRR